MNTATTSADAATLIDAGVPLWIVVLLVVVLALGGGAGLYQLVIAKASARKIDAEGDKTDADAVQTIVAAATALVEPLQKRIATIDGELERQRDDISSLRNDLHQRDQLAAEHSGWDHFVELKARDAGIELPPRPPLRPMV